MADITLHCAVPLTLFAYWILHAPRQQAATLTPLAWSVDPTVYLPTSYCAAS
ncbi:hypothetical protein [Duganella violaceipulchra]|uniref:Uncharacterized protein n=1 Tax=Duganella violaceipulchra TaxID=2849652 RepID=A0ABT1GLG2_9BURK|nr:hypothetical protein [Duganella violaceicalia]MCP2009816.1 hypothetical protein [Duganella violaceicalia]